MFVRPSEITLGEAFLAGDSDVMGDFPSVFHVAEYVFHRPQRPQPEDYFDFLSRK
jgi:hypothetical protein